MEKEKFLEEEDGKEIVFLTREKALKLMYNLANELGYEVTLAERPLTEIVH